MFNLLGTIMPFLKTILPSLGSTLLTNHLNQQSVKQQQDWNEKMMDKQNAYNAPAAQLERLKDAGINPNANNMAGGDVIAGNISASPNGSGLIPMQDPVTNAGNFVSSLMNAFKSQQEGLDSQSFREVRLEQIRDSNLKLLAECEALGLNNANQRIVNQYTDALYTYQLEGYKYDFGLKLSQIRYCHKQYEELVYRINELLPQEKRINDANLSRIFAEIQSIEASTNLANEQANTEVMKQAELDASAQNLNQNTISSQETLDKILEQYQATIDKIRAETGLTEQESYWYLFKLATETEGKAFGVPLPGTGAIHNNISRSNVANQARKKYE